MVIGCTTVVMGVVLLSDARRVLSKIFHLSSLISALFSRANPLLVVYGRVTVIC